MGNNSSNDKKIYKQHQVISEKLHNIPENLSYPQQTLDYFRRATPEQVRQ